MSDIKVKLFIGTEIRRLALPSKTHYDDLVQKVYNFYLTQQPDATPETLAALKFKYLDVDGDWVSFSSNEEWREAFSNFQEVLKIKVEGSSERKYNWKQHCKKDEKQGEGCHGFKRHGGCHFGGRRHQQDIPNFFQQFMGGQNGQQKQPNFDFSQLGNMAQSFMTPENMEMAKNLFQQFTGGQEQPFDFSKMKDFLPKEGQQGDFFSNLFGCNTNQEQKESKPVHHGIICDGCEKTPVGTRFQCQDCKDFDFCDDCFKVSSSSHFEGKHNFRKVEKPEKLSCPFFKCEKKETVEVPKPQEEAPKIEEEIIMDEELYDVVEQPSAPKVEDAPKVEEPKNPTENALKLLAQMGFSNQSVNEYLLKKHNGDIQRVVFDLLNN